MHGNLYVQSEKIMKTKWPPNHKLSITHSFLELQTPDFAWMFIWYVPTNNTKFAIFTFFSLNVLNEKEI